MTNHNSLVAVDCPQGKLLGTPTRHQGKKSTIEIGCFRGIPYALPPVGVRRWRPAEPAPPWQGTRMATQYAPNCPQPQQQEDAFYYMPGSLSSEDCLYLNIWTPVDAIESNEKLPVMVWIHGGSLVEGSGSLRAYDGAALASKGVVIVTINYRLNVFGYFCHPELVAESVHNAAGNYGITDQLQALKWVQQNIVAFGGDPDRVTVFGESAGALSISHLLASPLAKGLFHRAILQSGYLQRIPTLSEAEQTGLEFAEAVAQSVNGPHQSHSRLSLNELRALSANELLSIASAHGFCQIAESAQAVLDGWLLKAQIYDTFEQGGQHSVPLLAGYNSGEASSFFSGLEQQASVNQYIEQVQSRYGELTDAYLKLYPPDNLQQAVVAPATEGFYGWAAERFARMTSNASNKAYLYYFDYEPAWCKRRGLGAFHGLEVGYVFNNVDHFPQAMPHNWGGELADEVDCSMADFMSDFWVAFARDGEPRVTGQPGWQPYTAESRHYMHFSNGIARPRMNLRPGMFELHEAVVMQRRQNSNQTWWLSDIGLSAPEINPLSHKE